MKHLKIFATGCTKIILVGEPDISYNDYLKKNLNFLHHKYEGQKSEQKGKDMDGLNKYFGVHSL